MAEITAILDRRNDLSTFLVHLTRPGEDRTALDNLVSICESRTLEARSPVGWARKNDSADDLEQQSQRAICFTETPLEHVHALAGSITLWGRERGFPLEPYGVAISKMAARRTGVNPVWYVDMTSGRDWVVYHALTTEAEESGAFHSHPTARILPFIEKMGRWDVKRPYPRVLMGARVAPLRNSSIASLWIDLALS